MTISAALNSANSSLRAIQTQLAVASSNIANADDTSYTKKYATQAPTIAAGAGTGVDITAIINKVDANLVRSIVDAASGNASAQTMADYLQQLSDSLGSLSSTESGDTLATLLSSLESTLDELATTPESVTLKSQAVTDLEDGLASLLSTSNDVQTLRADADSAIGNAVTTVNDALHDIDELNKSIVAATAAGTSTADLEDQRTAALITVSEQLDVNYYIDGTGAMNVHTSSGQVLVGSTVHELSFDTTSSINANTTYPGTLSGITVNGHDITQSLRSGEISALVTLRDTTLTGVQSDLDAMAVSLRDTLNTISNQGSAAPPPNSLTGTEQVAAADLLSATGTLRVAVTDADGAVTATQDFNLSTYATVNAMLTALNGAGLGMTASIDIDGHLLLKATSATGGVAVAGGTIGTENFSGYFGLNDMVVGDGADNIAVKTTLSADTSTFPIGTMSTSGTLALGDTAVTSGSGALAEAMADAMRTADLSAAAGTIVANVGSALSSATSRATSAETSLTALTDSFSSQYGVNVDEETARISELQNAYAASAQVLSSAQEMFDALLNAVR